jgi:hypothetical protein
MVNGSKIMYRNGTPYTRTPLNIGGRVNPDPHHGHSSALTYSLYQNNMGNPHAPQYQNFSGQDDAYLLSGNMPGSTHGIPIIDTSLASPPGSAYGSPRGEYSRRNGFGLSPIPSGGLNVLDAPLPASFESNGMSHFANCTRSTPVSASVPIKFGIDSPFSSLGHVEGLNTPSHVLKNLRDSAFGESSRDRTNGSAYSPSGAPTEEYFGKKTMHSHRLAKESAITGSLPKYSSRPGMAIDRDWSDDFVLDMLPGSLKSEIMTDEERGIREPRFGEGEGRPIYSGNGTPVESSKWGSPSGTSPSRWGPLWTKNQEEERASRVSAFGHVGSPLRNSTLHSDSSPNSRPTTRQAHSFSSNGDSPFLASPPKQSSMSMISQQLQRTRLQRAESSGNETGFIPGSRSVSNGNGNLNPIGAPRRTELDRAISSSSAGGNSGRLTTPIDEEVGEGVFAMDEEDKEKERDKRNSGLGSSSAWTTFAVGRSTNGTNGERAADGNTGREAPAPGASANGRNSKAIDSIFGGKRPSS